MAAHEGLEHWPATWRFRIPAARESEIEAQLQLAGFTDYAILVSDDRWSDLHCWPRDHALFAALARGCMLGDPQIEPTVMPACMTDPDLAWEFVPGVWTVGATASAPDGAQAVIRLHDSDLMGSGRHPTSRSAAGLITDFALDGCRVADIGCGSGLLGLLAMRRGAVAVHFVDCDADACRLAQRNLALNRCEGVVHCGSLLDPLDDPVDVVVANLWTEPALELLAHPRLNGLLPNGDLVLAGIPLSERDAILSECDWRGFVVQAEGEAAWWWACRARRRAL